MPSEAESQLTYLKWCEAEDRISELETLAADNSATILMLRQRADEGQKHWDRIRSLEAERDAAKRCDDCACELTDFGHGVGLRCRLCDMKDKLDAAIKRAEAAESAWKTLRRSLGIVESSLRDRDAQCAAMRKALAGLLADTQHTDHDCNSEPCPVRDAEAVLASDDAGKPLLAYIERLEKAIEGELLYRKGCIDSMPICDNTLEELLRSKS